MVLLLSYLPSRAHFAIFDRITDSVLGVMKSVVKDNSGTTDFADTTDECCGLLPESVRTPWNSAQLYGEPSLPGHRGRALGATDFKNPKAAPPFENQKQVMPVGVAWAQIKVFVVVTACICP